MTTLNIFDVLCKAYAKMQRLTTFARVLRLTVLLLCLVPQGGSAPVRVRRDTETVPRWLQPCRGNTPVSKPSGHTVTIEPSTLPIHQHWDRIVRSADQAKESVQTLMNRYVSERFEDPHFPTYLEELILEGMPTAPPKIVIEEGDIIEVEESLENTYDNLAKVAVFVEVARKDEYLKQSRIFTSHFVQEIREIEELHIYNLLCHLEGALHAHERDVTTDVTHEVMSAEYREIDNHAMRHNRDYIILRDTHKFLDYVSYHFNLILNQSLSPQPTTTATH